MAYEARLRYGRRYGLRRAATATGYATPYGAATDGGATPYVGDHGYDYPFAPTTPYAYDNGYAYTPPVPLRRRQGP